METTLMDRLINAGYLESDCFHWQSDLYVFATSLTSRVINEWLDSSGLSKDAFVSTFIDQITRRGMYEVAFAYDPFWKERAEYGQR